MDMKGEYIMELITGFTYEDAVDTYADMITRLCLLRCSCTEDAKDCFQNTFLKLYQKPPEFRSKEHIKAWLIQVTIHECVDYNRQFWKRRVVCTDVIEEFINKNSAITVDSDSFSMTKAVMKLPVKYRQVIYLYYFEEYEVNEIATLLHKSPNTIKSQLSRGRERLKKLIGGSYE